MDSHKPADASGLLQKDAFKALGLNPDRSIREQLGGPKNYTYHVHKSKSSNTAFYLKLEPDDNNNPTLWYKFTAKPNIDPASAPVVTDEQIAQTERAAETLSQLSYALAPYNIPPKHLQIALATGDRSLIGEDMARINKAGQLPQFSEDVINAVMPAEKNQDGTDATAEQIEANKIRNEVMADNLHATILSELLLHQKATLNDGRVYKTPDTIANEVNDKLKQLNQLRKNLNIPSMEPMYYSIDKQMALFSSGQPYHRNDIIRYEVLNKIQEIVTPEAGMSKPEFVWGNRVVFMADGFKAFNQRLADIDRLIALAEAGEEVTYDYTIWKHYADKPADPYHLGVKLRDKLLQLADAGAKCHITVDRTVAFRDPTVIVIDPDSGAVLGGLLAPLAQHPNISLCFFNNDERGTPGDSNHSKSAIANGYQKDASAIVGGRNIHGSYFFDWLDGEFFIEGELAQSVQRAEDDMWIQQARLHQKPNLIRQNIHFQKPDKKGDIIGLATHEMPGPDSTFNGLIGVLSGFEISGFEFTLIQAYVLPPIPGAKTNPTLEVIKRAVRDGRIINIVTNSPETIDVPQISSAIVKYAAHLLEQVNGMPDASGALRIFMKKKWDGIGGGTLHAKIAYDDKWYVSDTSNNLHANGFLQHESQRYYLDDELNESVRAWGKQLIERCDMYTAPQPLWDMAKKIDASNALNPALNALLTLFPYQV
ncbi:phospholipase D-like domain-containing protein [methane-oxidizing endosymbiont of Gigantopelta aegis]|uniref:phospholipase D-like domain-containing protein n=1 Tax=methane-oxidizing endosymbiont of Gigantopelta aegis TaxID=2794938 RepID=UPI0018DE6692|nr:phosphatidylserine/phosphatidylglycerophosphate/cardiolipin synthase family protein [methane-oxidizing endosymbiont of Gigantopelta aegis]